MHSTADPIEQDFIDALERLKASKPTNKDLAKKVKLGKKVKINLSNVALEAGHSRTPIATRKNCKYPKVRQAILEATKPVVPEHTAEYAIRTLREANAELQKENRLLLSVHAALLRRMDRIENETKRHIRDAQRAARQSPGPIIGRSLNPQAIGEVLHFPGTTDEGLDDER